MGLPSFLFETVYQFSPAVKAALNSGQLKQVISISGKLLPIVRDPATGRFVEIAKATTRLAVGPVAVMGQVVTGAIQTGVLGFQMDRGFQKTYQELAVVQEGIKSLQGGMASLQASVGVLQASTAVIGVGVASGIVLSAVSLHQILKLRKDVSQMRLEMKDGFIDLKSALQDQGTAVLSRIDEVANDLKFHSQKLLMIKAYGQFREALRLIVTALVCANASTRNDTLTTALNLLTNALSIYNSPELFVEASAVGMLRRLECVWAIEQTIALIYQLRGEPAAVLDRLTHLRQTIQGDSLRVIDHCESEDELDVLFPEIARIQQCDLSILETWQEQIEWCQVLVPKEQKQLSVAEISTVEDQSDDGLEESVLPEQSLYNTLKPTSHYLSLRDQLRFIVKPDLRSTHEQYISDRSKTAGYKALAPSSWDGLSDSTVANLYWHLKRSEQAA